MLFPEMREYGPIETIFFDTLRYYGQPVDKCPVCDFFFVVIGVTAHWFFLSAYNSADSI